MEIKAMLPTKDSSFCKACPRKDAKGALNGALSQSDPVVLNWKLQRSKSPTFETKSEQSKTMAVEFTRKDGLRGKR